MAIKEYAGGAPTTTLSSGINATATSFQVADGSNYPTGATGNFWIEIGGFSISNGVVTGPLSTAEKVKCSARSGNTFTIASSGRGGDGTVASSHNANEVVKHVFVAEDAREANDHINNVTVDHHTQYLNATRHDITARHTPGTVIPSSSTATDLSNTTGGSAGSFSLGDHAHGFGVWTAYTPFWSATNANPSIGNGTLEGRYLRVGKMGWVYIKMLAGTSTSFGTGFWSFSYPSGWSTSQPSFGQTMIYIPGATFLGVTWMNNGTKTGITWCPDNSPESVALGIVTESYPYTWAPAVGPGIEIYAAGIELD